MADATHIFDGLNTFPTHVTHMRLGAFVSNPIPWTPQSPLQDPIIVSISSGSTLHALALLWLKEDREFRRELEKKGRKTRGAKRDDVPSDSEQFFRK